MATALHGKTYRTHSPPFFAVRSTVRGVTHQANHKFEINVDDARFSIATLAYCHRMPFSLHKTRIIDASFPRHLLLSNTNPQSSPFRVCISLVPVVFC